VTIRKLLDDECAPPPRAPGRLTYRVLRTELRVHLADGRDVVFHHGEALTAEALAALNPVQLQRCVDARALRLDVVADD